jgi:DNA polymerase
MSHYQSALEATEEHLLALKSSGVRFLNVQAETLFDLQQPAPEQLGNSENHESGIEKQKVAEIQQHQAPPTSAAPPAEAVSLREKKEAAMAELRGRALACLKCPHLAKARQKVVFGVGDIHARLMFVGEAPGADEDAQGEPFVGAAGQLLTRIIKAMGFSRETVYIANILKCRPDTPGQTAGNRKPTPEEMKTCLPYLLAQIDLIQPRVLVALGATAMEGLLGKDEGIGKLRGHFQMFRDIPLMPTFHPAYLLRNQAMREKRKVWEDMLQVLEKLGAEISEKQRGFFLQR